MHIPKKIEHHEKFYYLNHHQGWLTFFSLLSFFGVTYSSLRFFSVNPVLYVFFPFLFFSIFYYLVSILVQGFGKSFDFTRHKNIVGKWKPKKYPTVDIFLPICGENIDIVHNTWLGVSSVREAYPGKVEVYCLDDGASKEAESLAKEFDFNYLVRDNRGHFKKAGNLHHGFKNSFHEFIVIFDADFRPKPDFLNELLPYFSEFPKLGIVQSPQYFDVKKNQNWLERGAGAVQEFFYRAVQQSRQTHNGAICVGSNAIYRRAALEANGGTTLIEHSEDVHTGFDLRRHGWDLMYVPIILAKGVCPNDLKSFFRQQYRWCRGSMSLLGSDKFWQTKLPAITRLCYFTGFLYYIQTAIMIFVAPLIPLALLYIVPEQADITNYLPLMPALLYSFIILPLWHRSKYRSETSSVKIILGWAHFFAIFDALMQKSMEWHPTGSTAKKSTHFSAFVTFLVGYTFLVGLIWIGGSVWRLFTWNPWDFLPVLLSGVAFMLATLRIIWLMIKEHIDIDKKS